MQYFSDQERGPQPRSLETISPTAWGGIIAAVKSAVEDGSFGEDFPETCPDGGAVCGSDSKAFPLALKAEVHGIEWPLQLETSEGEGWQATMVPYAPHFLDALDLIQFCYRHVSKATQHDYHSYFRHHHLSFDRDSGRREFRARINRIFSRNGISFDLLSDGTITRLAPPVLAEALRSPLRPTFDSALDHLFEDARRKFLSPDLKVRKESLEKLWDAWERLKTLHVPLDKKASVARLLEQASPESKFRERLNREAHELTEIGNHFMIRHSEVEKTPIDGSSQVDYLFHRLFALTRLLIENGLDKR